MLDMAQEEKDESFRLARSTRAATSCKRTSNNSDQLQVIAESPSDSHIPRWCHIVFSITFHMDMGMMHSR